MNSILCMLSRLRDGSRVVRGDITITYKRVAGSKDGVITISKGSNVYHYWNFEVYDAERCIIHHED